MTASAPRVLLVIGHGKASSLCHRLAEVVLDAARERGSESRVHDLLADGFDPVLRLQPGDAHAPAVDATTDPLVHRYQEDVRWADVLVIVHPVWWFGPPAILKGWVDRVLVRGIAFEHPPGEDPQPLLTGRRALVVQTLSSSRMVDSVVFRGLAGLVWRRAVFGPIGITARRIAIHSVDDVGDERLQAHCARLARALATVLDRA